MHLRYPSSFHAALKDLKDSVHLTTYYVCPYLDGGLGNLMFEYASAYGIADTKGMALALNEDLELYQYFELSIPHTVEEQEICKGATPRGEYHPCGYDKQVFDFDKSRNTQLTGYMQSWKYFQHVENDLRRQFNFRESVKSSAKTVIHKVVSPWVAKDVHFEDLTLIGVHIRRGDIMEKQKVDYGYVTASEDYIERAMNYYRDKYKNTIFLCFSNPNANDTKWVQENVNGSDVIVMTPRAREIDMCILSMCNHTIMTVGSFGWWASWLNTGETVYSLLAAAQNSSLEEDFGDTFGNYFYPGWIGL